MSPVRPVNDVSRMDREKMAGAGGFEPPTFRFVAECSIQLSYAPRILAKDSLRERGIIWVSPGQVKV